MNDDRDRDIAEKLASRIMNDEQIANRQSLIGVIESALATVRREEQEAAFKLLCPDCAEGSTPTFDQTARWYYHGLGHKEVGCSASKLRIAALESTTNPKPVDEPRAHILKELG